MCGIAGIVGDVDHVRAKLHRMADTQLHRGPDACHVTIDTFIDTCIGMVHNRLSIAGKNGDEVQQPYYDAETGYTVMMDGRIGNTDELRNELRKYYTFRTTDAVEIISKAYHRWGTACLSRFEGAFSIAIYDPSSPQLFLARDRFGVKPLFYTFQNGSFYFASEIKALFAVDIPMRFSVPKWSAYLVYNYVNATDDSFWEGIAQIPAGGYAYLNINGFDVGKWYVFEDEIKKTDSILSEQDVLPYILDLAGRSISRYIADNHEVGVSLTGDAKSSFLLELLKQYSGNKKISVYSYFAGNKQYNRVKEAHELLRNTHTPIDLVALTAKRVKEECIRAVHVQDEPFDSISTINYSSLLEQAKNQGKVIICDAIGLNETRNGLPLSQVRNRAGYYNPDFVRQADAVEYPRYFEDEDDNARYISLFYTDIPMRLRCDDRVSMIHSIDLRKPFLDHKLIEYAFTLPKYLKAYRGQDKWMIRLAVSFLLSSSMRLTPDGGQEAQWSRWYAHELKDWVEEALDGILNSPVSDWFDSKKLRQEWTGYCEGKEMNIHRVWQWINLYLLLKKVY